MPSLPFRIDMAMVLAPTRTRRIVLAVCLVTFFVIYFRTLSFKTKPEEIQHSNIIKNFPVCLSKHREEIEHIVNNLDGIVYMGSSKPEKFTMVGNGFVVAVPFTGSHSILLDNGISLDINHNINLKYFMGDSPLPLLLSVLNLRKGQVDLFYVGPNCVTVRETIFAATDHTSIILHRVVLNNPSPSSKKITIKNSVDTHLDNTQTIDMKDKRKAVVHSDLVRAHNGDSYVVAAATLLSHKIVDIKGKSQVNASLLVSLHSSHLADVGERSEKIKSLSSEVQESLNEIKVEDLLEEHETTWREMQSSGLRLQPLQDHLMAKPLNINMTLYYLLSMYRPLPESKLSSHQGCFKGSPTSHSPVLWTSTKSIDSLYTFLTTWKNELNAGGCSLFIHADRVIFHQALLRSFAGILQNDNGLELALNPHSMEGYVTIYGIDYEGVMLNISIVINTPTHAGYVSVSKARDSDVNIYGCDQICSSDIISLPGNGGQVTFNIKPTNPSTPILYLAKSTNQLVLVRQLLEEHHGLDLHSLEEHPISALFIIVVSLVILIFHALLFHMIYKEFCAGDRSLRRA